MNLRTEPARVIGYVSGAITSGGTFLLQWGQGGDWRIALGSALLAFAVPAGAAEVVRSQVYSPASADEIIDAESAVARLEGEA